MVINKVLVIGIDSAAPQLVFDKWKSKLPNLSSLMKKGLYGPMKTCIPPITIPAWSCMMTGKNPGRLGCYGYRNRSDYSYSGLSFASSKTIREDRIWDILSRQDKKVILVGIPQTYPPSPVNGLMVSGFLTPDTTCRYTYPEKLADEIKNQFGDYILDVDNFRTTEKDLLLKQIYTMTRQRFSLFKYLIETNPWDFAMMVDMGIDRIQHAFWKYMDNQHPKYKKGNPHEEIIREYYKFVDKMIGEIIETLDNSTAVYVVSDHGAKAMKGGFCINEWLMQNSYLSVINKPKGIIPLSKAKIDWTNTTAWAEGGYYSRLFLNVKNREPQGVISEDNYENTRSELINKLEATKDVIGDNLVTKAFRPEDVYSETNGIPPDLIVYFGNLEWRSIGSIGYNKYHTFENDLGPDDANHSEHGIYIISPPGDSPEKNMPRKKEISIFDIAPSILDMLDVAVPEDMEGHVV